MSGAALVARVLVIAKPTALVQRKPQHKRCEVAPQIVFCYDRDRAFADLGLAE